MAKKKQVRLSFPDSVRAILTARTPDEETKETLEGLGLDPTVLNAIHWGMSGKAAKGDAAAAKYLRDTLEEEKGGEPEGGEGLPDLSGLSDGALRAMAAKCQGGKEG